MTRRPYPPPPSRPRWLTDGEHARADTTCQRCHDHYTAYAFIAPDPEGRATVRVERMVAAWQTSHPCTPTAYARPTVKGKQAA